MAEEASIEPMGTSTEQVESAAEDMDLVESANGAKRAREGEEEEQNGDASKKQKVDDKSVEEERLDTIEEGKVDKIQDDKKEEEEKVKVPVELGPKSFGSSVEMFDYFYGFLHHWPTNLNVNEYEHLVLLELLKTGHLEPEKKIGGGIQAFQIRFHPTFKSRCFFLIRDDDSVDDFSFRKCVDHILPLPENMKVKADANKSLGGRGGKGGGGKGGYRGRGRGGKSRN